MVLSELAVYGSLFLSALVAATILPMQSEAVFVAYLIAEAAPALALLTVASLGNTLGAVVNWLLGRGLERFKGRRWFPVGPQALARAQAWYARWGRWSLLLSWMPVIGDPITVAAGVMREPFWRFLLLVGLAKTGRYLVLMLAVS